jgi:hypothetical protein
MMAGRAPLTPVERYEGWLWALMPPAVLVAVFLLSAVTSPYGECQVSEPPIDTEETWGLIVCGFLVLLMILGAAYLMWRFWSSPRGLSVREWIAVPVAAVIAAISAYYAVNQHDHSHGTWFILAVPLAIGCYFLMIAGLVHYRRAEAIGILVPATLLLFAGVIVVPVGWGIQELSRSGGLC